MSKQTERDEFVIRLTKELPEVSTHLVAELAGKVLRASASLQRYAELACSSEAADRDRVMCPAQRTHEDADCVCDCGAGDGAHEDVPRITVLAQRARRRVRGLLEPYGIVPLFQGDPRGYVLRLRVPSGVNTTWAGDGIGVPA